MLLPTKRRAISRLRKLLPSFVNSDDINVMYDDTLLSCVKMYEFCSEASFNTYLFESLENARKMYIRHLNAKQKKIERSTESIDCPIADDTERTLEDVIVDDTSVNPVDNLICSDIISSLNAFRDTNKTNKAYADLIVCCAIPFNSEEEKLLAVSKVIGEEIGKSAMHKRIKRARSAFKTFLQKN